MVRLHCLEAKTTQCSEIDPSKMDDEQVKENSDANGDTAINGDTDCNDLTGRVAQAISQLDELFESTIDTVK